MFMSIADYEFYVPPELAPPGSKYWRSVCLSTNAAWFVLTVRHEHPEPHRETFLLAWDQDVADAIHSLKAQVVELMCIAPSLSLAFDGWRSLRIREVWEAINPNESDATCVVMVADDGREYAGYFMEPIRGAKKIKRVVTIGTPARVSSRHTND